MLLDIDNFKEINDTYGHIVGDNVIKHFSRTIKNNIPSSSQSFRLGGDEFAIIFERSEITQIMVLAEKLRLHIKNHIYTDPLNEIQITYSVSIGIATCEHGPKKWYNNADQALYRAKRDGKDKIVFFDA